MHWFGVLGRSRLMAACVSLVCLAAACGGGKDGPTGPGGGGSGEVAGDYWRDQNGANYSSDHGRYRLQGNRLQFTSRRGGDQFEGQVGGGLLELTWDFCNDNQGPELQLTFSN